MRNKVLIVDDVEINRSILRSILENEYTIVEAENGKQASGFPAGKWQHRSE